MAQFIDQFIRNLQPEEAKAVTRYIKNNVANGEESKTLEVVEAMLAGKQINYKSPAALNTIKSRIFEKSLDALLVDDNYLNTTLSGTDRSFVKLKKQLLQCKILYRPGLNDKNDAVRRLCEQIITEAKKDELYSILTEALILKKYRMIQRTKGFLEVEEINTEIEFYNYCSDALLKAADDYHYVVINENFVQSNSRKEVNQYIARSIKRMETDVKKTQSQMINYYLYIMKFALCERKKEYDGAVQLCKDLINLLVKHKYLYRKERMGFAYENLSYFNVYQNRYNEAEKNMNKARTYLPANSFYLVVQAEFEFRIFLYNKKYLDASKCIDHLLKQSLSVVGEFRHGKYIYFNACLLFQQKRYKEALSLLTKPLAIEKDKERWNISVRILTIMLYIELNRNIDASRILEALRKYMDRNKINEKIEPRDVLIIKALRELEKGDFEYNKKNTALNTLQKQLSAKNKAVSWEHFSAELIPFHEWLEGK